MRKRIITIAGLVVAVLLGGWLIDRSQGAALDVGDGSMTVGVPVAGQDVDVYLYAPDLVGRDAVELVRVAPDVVGSGVEFVDARVYRREDFVDGVPFSWTPGNGDASDPTRVASGPIDGYRLTGEPRDRVILFRVRVTSDRRPLKLTGIRVTYRNGVRAHSQVIHANYEVTAPRPAG